MAKQRQQGKRLKPAGTCSVSRVATDYERLRGSSSPASAETFLMNMNIQIATNVPGKAWGYCECKGLIILGKMEGKGRMKGKPSEVSVIFSVTAICGGPD